MSFDLFDACCREIIDLHAFFEGWFRGTIDPDDPGRLELALAADFEIITPEGRHLSRLKTLAGVVESHGSRAADPGFRIRITALRPRFVGPEAALVMYEEWHDRGGEVARSRGRVSSALFLRDRSGPLGVIWKHLHETFLAG